MGFGVPIAELSIVTGHAAAAIPSKVVGCGGVLPGAHAEAAFLGLHPFAAWRETHSIYTMS